MTGAELISRILEDEGVGYVFGVPGSTEVPIMDAVAQNPNLKYVSAVHESVSAGMADGYARASGKVGVVLVHTAPGTANIIGNLYNAYNAGTPLVILGGQQDSRLECGRAYLDSNLLPMVSEFTKSCRWVGRCEDMGFALRRAFKEARTPPTGPVFLAIPRDLQEASVEADLEAIPRCSIPTAIGADRESLLEAAKLLVNAEQPAILAGYQVPDADAIPELVALAELLGAPVYTTAQVPKMIFPKTHPLYGTRAIPIGFGVPGLDSPPDVLLAVGSGLFKQILYVAGPLLPRGTKLIQIDLDPSGVAWDCPAEVALLANPKAALAGLAAEARKLISEAQRQKCRQRHQRFVEARGKDREAREADFRQEWDAVPIRPARVMKELAAALPRGGILVDESVMLTTYVEYIMEFDEVGSYFSCNASLGWGLPAALGVALAAPGKPVVALVGDGATLFGLQALWTAARYRIPVVMAVLNNCGFNAIKWAFKAYPGKASGKEPELGCELGDVDFPALARAFGVTGERVDSPAAIGPALEAAFGSGEPVLLDFALDPCDLGYGLPRLD